MMKVRNFVTITIVIAIVFFLFASQGMARLSMSDKGENHYATSPGNDQDKSDALKNINSNRNYIFVGRDKSLYHTARQYAIIRHASLHKTLSIAKAASEKSGENTVYLIDGSLISQSDIYDINEILDHQSVIVFMTLPDEKLIESSGTLRDILGIQRTRGDIHIKGYQLFKNFMLGGEAYYVEDKVEKGEKPRQDLPLDITYYEVASACRSYMIGQIDPRKQDIKDLDNDNTKNIDAEDYPAVIWQHSPEKGHVFCINGDFMKNDTGLGILSGIEYETSDYLISSFADARSFVVQNFPDLADENDDQINELYGQNPYNFQRNVLWPFIVSAASINNDRITAMAADHIKMGTGLYSRMDSYLTLAENERAELGAMGEGASLVQKGLSATFPDYDITSFYGQGDKGVVLTDDGKYLYGMNDKTLDIRTTLSADEMKYSDDLRFRGVVSATGYYVTALDVSKVIYPESKDDRYEKVTRRTNGNLNSYYGKFSYLDALPLSQAARKIENLADSDYRVVSSSKDDKKVVMRVENPQQSSEFLLRTHGQGISAIEGATYEKIEDDSYIIKASDSDIVIRFVDEDKPDLTE